MFSIAKVPVIATALFNGTVRQPSATRFISTRSIATSYVTPSKRHGVILTVAHSFCLTGTILVLLGIIPTAFQWTAFRTEGADIRKAHGGTFFTKARSGTFFRKARGGTFFRKARGGTFFRKARSGTFFGKARGGTFLVGVSCVFLFLTLLRYTMLTIAEVLFTAAAQSPTTVIRASAFVRTFFVVAALLNLLTLR